MRRTATIRSWFVFAAAALFTAAGEFAAMHGADAAASTLPDGSVRYDFGRRPSPVLTCKPEFVCDITLESGESVLNLAIGDSTHWVIAGGKSGVGGTTPHVFVKPTQAHLDTNLLITTTRRTYDITLRSATSAPHSHISFAYVDEAAAEKAAIAEHERQAIQNVLNGTPLVSSDRADSRYKISGEQTLLPEKVFNDGVRTYIQWKALPAELPDVAIIGKDGLAQPVNFRVVANMYILDSTDPNFDLILGAEADRRGRPERRVTVRHE